MLHPEYTIAAIIFARRSEWVYGVHISFDYYTRRLPGHTIGHVRESFEREAVSNWVEQTPDAPLLNVSTGGVPYKIMQFFAGFHFSLYSYIVRCYYAVVRTAIIPDDKGPMHIVCRSSA